MEAGEAGGVSHLKLVQLLLDNQANWQEIVDPTIASDISKPNQVWTSHTYTPMTTWSPAAPQWAEAFTLASNELHLLYLQGKLAALPAGKGMGDGTGAVDYSPGYYNAMTRTQALYVAWRLARMADTIHGVWGKPWLDTEFGKDYTQAAVDVWLNISCGVKRDYGITGWTYFCYCSNINTGTSTDAYNINRPATQAVVLPVLTPWITQP